MKNYPLDPNTVMGLDDEGVCAWYSKGHHDAAPFLQAVMAEDDEVPANADVLHEWWRNVPVQGNAVADCRVWRAAPGSPGAYPVTVVDLRGWER